MAPSPLQGWTPAPGLVGGTIEDGGRSVRLYRHQGGIVTSECEPFAPFVLAAESAPLRAASGLVDLRELAGPGELRWMARFESWSGALAARERVRAAGRPHWFTADPIHHHLVLSGRTSFGGLRFGDLRRLALDIEVLTTEGFDFPSAARPGDRIIAVALAAPDGFRHVVRGDLLEEAALLEACGRIIRERDPDVIEGHNIFRFDLEYLEARARRHGLVLAWGRGGETVRSRLARLAVAERTIGYRRFEIPGRHVVDTWMLAQLHDAGTRDLPAFGLKDLARHFGVAAPDRTYLDPATIPREFREAPERLMAYASDDAVETLALSAILAPPYFAQAQIVPFDYQATILRGAAAKIDALLLRESLREGHAVPLPRPVGPVGGGFTAVFQQGVARPVLHVDVTSLYPSVMLAGGIAPATDTLGRFPALLRMLTDVRLEAKRRMREAGDKVERAHLHALQQAFKILINAFYGYLAFSGAHWNDFMAADRVTAEGRRIVGAILDRLAALGATPIEVDTDGVYFVPPFNTGADAEDTLLVRIAEGLPAGIQLEIAGRYAAMFSYKMKTYALLDTGGHLILKGSGFRSRGIEPFQRRLIEDVVRLLLASRGADVKPLIGGWLEDFAAHRVPLRQFARTETLQDPLEVYRERVAAGARNPSAGYEVALASGLAFAQGDQVTYYVAGRGGRAPIHESAKLASRWSAEDPDENVEHYQGKVLEVWARFQPFTELEGLRPCVAEPEAAPPAQLELF